MKEITLEFFKDKEAIDFPWEQPNTPWMVVPRIPIPWIDEDGRHDDAFEEEYNAKLMIDHPTKRVWIKHFDGESWSFIPLGEFFAWEFSMLDSEHILTHSHEFFYDTIADLKRNLKNKQHQKILFTVDPNQLGAKKIRDDEK